MKDSVVIKKTPDDYVCLLDFILKSGMQVTCVVSVDPDRISEIISKIDSRSDKMFKFGDAGGNELHCLPSEVVFLKKRITEKKNLSPPRGPSPQRIAIPVPGLQVAK